MYFTFLYCKYIYPKKPLLGMYTPLPQQFCLYNYGVSSRDMGPYGSTYKIAEGNYQDHLSNPLQSTYLRASFKNLGILPLKLMYNFQFAIFMFKVYENIHPLAIVKCFNEKTARYAAPRTTQLGCRQTNILREITFIHC